MKNQSKEKLWTIQNNTNVETIQNNITQISFFSSLVGYDWLLWDNGDVGKHVKEPDIDIGSSLLSEETKDAINMPDDREIELNRHKRAAGRCRFPVLCPKYTVIDAFI